VPEVVVVATCRWLGVNEIFLKENGPAVSPLLKQRLQPLIDEGFLHLGILPGAKHPLQNRWYNRCSKPDMAGQHSWVAFIDLDEFIVVLDKCAARLCACVPTVACYSLVQLCLCHRPMQAQHCTALCKSICPTDAGHPRLSRVDVACTSELEIHAGLLRAGAWRRRIQT
jgi:hypothetical protein